MSKLCNVRIIALNYHHTVKPYVKSLRSGAIFMSGCKCVTPAMFKDR